MQSRMANIVESVDVHVDCATRTCQLCNESYTDPLLLPCLHSFCKKCLAKFKEKQEVSDATITCPSCDEVATVPSINGVLAFPQNLWLAHHVEEERCREKLSGKPRESTSCERCVSGRASGKGAVVFCCECCEFLCPTCKQDHQQNRHTLNHVLVEQTGENTCTINAEIKLKIPRKKQFCPHHDGEKLKFFCEKCQEITCCDCLMLSHKDHPYGYCDKVAEKGREDLKTSLQGCDEVIAALDDDIGKCKKMIQHIETRKKEVDRELDDVYDALLKVLADRFKTLKNENAQIASSKTADISKQVDTLTKLKSQASRGRSFCNIALKTHEPSELLSVKKSIEGFLVHCKTSFKERSHEPIEDDCVQADLKHSSLSDQIAQFGRVLAVDVDPALCSIEAGVAVPLATVGKKRKFVISLKNSSGGSVREVIPLQIVLKSSNGQEIPVTISTEDDPSRPTLTFTPDMTGEHELSVMVTDTHIQSSPYRMWVRKERDLFNIDKPAQLCFNVGNYTHGVAVHHNGDIYCTDYNNFCIQIFDKNGIQKTKIGSSNSSDSASQLKYPWGLAIVRDVLYVTDNNNHRVQKFTTTGEYIGQFGSNGSGDGQFSYPKGVTHDGQGHVIVADYQNCRIQIFQLDGTHVRSISCDGSRVYGVAVDNDGNIHVPLYSKNIVQVYSFDGQELTSYGNPSGNFSCPRGIFIDDNGYRYITAQCSSNYCLHILNSQGNQVKLISIHDPWGVALDIEGYIYIAEHMYSNICVSKY